MNTFALFTFIIIILLHQQILSQVESKNNLSHERILVDRDTSMVIINEQIKEKLNSKHFNNSPPRIIIQRKMFGDKILGSRVIKKNWDHSE